MLVAMLAARILVKLEKFEAAAGPALGPIPPNVIAKLANAGLVDIMVAGGIFDISP